MSGSVFAKKKALYFKLKINGTWKSIPTPFRVGQEAAAQKALEKVKRQLEAGQVVAGDMRPVTVEQYAKTWLEERKTQVEDWVNDESRLRLHILPALGALRLDETRPHHIVALISALRKSHAPKTVYNVYSVLSALFRDALIADLIETTPCVLTVRQLGPKRDKNPEWRPTAVYVRTELELLVSDERIPLDRRALYALEGIGALRHGEAAGLRWRNCMAPGEPLTMLVIAFSYDGPVKGGITRFMPVHPTLAAILAEWRLFGWEAMMGRKPTEDDLVVPLPLDTKWVYDEARRAKTQKALPAGMRSHSNSWERLKIDLETLGFRHRRGHDLRRTMISLARSDGAQRDILRRGTHKPPKDVIEGYTTFEWDVLCREVSKLKISRRATGDVIAIPVASVGGRGGLSTPFLPSALTPRYHEEKRMTLPGFEPARITSVHVGSRSLSNEGRAETDSSARALSHPGAVQGGSVETTGRKVEGEIRLTFSQAEQVRAALQLALDLTGSPEVAAALALLGPVDPVQ